MTLLFCSFSTSNAFSATPLRKRMGSALHSSITPSATQDNPMRLTPELLKIYNAFESIGDEKLRFKQLSYMATKLTPIHPSQAIPQNKVPGCSNTVYVDGTVIDKGDGSIRINFVGDSDGVLTKGLAALLIRGLSGNTADDIQKVDPAFIYKICYKASLTPGRNNGFLNMLNVMKSKAKELEANHLASGKTDEISGEEGAMFEALLHSMNVLKTPQVKVE
ncbi:cysteine desulfuration protein SufE [Fistulifera solaris]|uniref:Cysteine desulfuration protein SufE n=1 Tax=Fistulifera solaris TaxID=1519565 RepID=A0A1Z5KBU8_FISSO|nr:cysteine desulfuration protein SufE [Fistulifera solaris]|eukprot:GAX23368.1 cysteine desulfuration protein SufE [Fistulifera solaris]